MNEDSAKIRVLDENTVNEIAAGEVIERPASVVKELVENSIDANATDIKVGVEGGSAEKLFVADNGVGMCRDDAVLGFTRHATSKIGKLEDLYNTSTLGFRGEALTTIASVSNVELTTRQKNDLAGTKVTVHPDGIKSVSDTGSSAGTTVVVENLFYNTPARRKHLKSERTELAHITDVVTKQALGNPHISFKLICNGRTVLRSPHSDNLFDTVVHVFGRDVSKLMIPINYEFQLISISGYISKPEFSRSGTDFQSFFINKRNVTSGSISNALRRGYHNLLPKGRYPAAVLNLSINPEEVDINVHPRKSHVRLNYEREITDAISNAVENALEEAELISLKSKDKEESTDKSAQIAINEMDTLETDDILAERPERYGVSGSGADSSREKYPSPNVMDTENRLRQSEKSFQGSSANRSQAGSDIGDIRVLSQVYDTYIVAELNSELVLIDQHAAHERIMYEHIRKGNNISRQELITPVTLELSVKEKVLMEEYIPYLEDLGFAISDFGSNTYIVTSVPTIFGEVENTDIIHDLISEILSAGRVKTDVGRYDQMCKTIACKSAIKSGNVCTTEQMQNLIIQLRNTENPSTCPHGRPTTLPLTRNELDSMFKKK